MPTDDLIWYGNGTSGYGGHLLELHRRLDALFCSWAESYQAQEYQFPPVLRLDSLEQISYLSSFPHLATFPTVLDPNEDNVEQFVEGLPQKYGDGVRLTRTAPTRDILTPAACYHVYVMLQHSKLSQSNFYTMKSTCYRNEATYQPLERQWAFTMREIVCVGTANVVKGFLAAMQLKLEGLFAQLKLPVAFDTATDPFFKPEASSKVLAQKLDPVKAEMVWENRLAIGSTNFHKNYFGESFAIQYDDTDAFSGCVAFGVERWMQMFLKHFGDSPGGWPELKELTSLS